MPKNTLLTRTNYNLLHKIFVKNGIISGGVLKFLWNESINLISLFRLQSENSMTLIQRILQT